MSNTKPILVRFKGLEILAKSGTIQDYRQGKISRNKVLVSETIFKDTKNGRAASKQELGNIFQGLGISGEDKMIEHILVNGDYQMTTKERQALSDQRRNQIIEYYCSNFVDPRTLVAHPPQRIQQALEKIKAHINYTVPFNKQINEIHKKIITVLGLKPV